MFEQVTSIQSCLFLGFVSVVCGWVVLFFSKKLFQGKLSGWNGSTAVLLLMDILPFGMLCNYISSYISYDYFFDLPSLLLVLTVFCAFFVPLVLLFLGRKAFLKITSLS